MHRRVGILATLCAALVAVSTLYAKQHYVLDVICGVALAAAAYAIFLARYPRERVPELDRRLAPVFALGVALFVSLALAGAWLLYASSGSR